MKKALPAIIIVAIVALVLIYLLTQAKQNTIDVAALKTWNGYVTRPAPDTMQIKAEPPLSEKTAVNTEETFNINKNGFEVDVQMDAQSLKDNSNRFPSIILREASGSATYPLELQVGVDNGRHPTVAFIDLNQEDPFQRRSYIVSDQNSSLAVSDKLKIVLKTDGPNQTISLYDGSNNSKLVENIALPKHMFTANPTLKIGLYAQGGDYNGVVMHIRQLKLVPDSRGLHL